MRENAGGAGVKQPTESVSSQSPEANPLHFILYPAPVVANPASVFGNLIELRDCLYHINAGHEHRTPGIEGLPVHHHA
jgi:hypothetical protein